MQKDIKFRNFIGKVDGKVIKLSDTDDNMLNTVIKLNIKSKIICEVDKSIFMLIEGFDDTGNIKGLLPINKKDFERIDKYIELNNIYLINGNIITLSKSNIPNEFNNLELLDEILNKKCILIKKLEVWNEY